MHSSISSPKRPRRRLNVILVSFAVLVLVLAGLQRWQLNEFAITPGSATDVPPLVTIKGVDTARHHDKVLLVDVYLSQLTMLQYLTFHLQSHVEFIPGSWLTSPGVPTSELNAQGYQEMSDSKTAATVAAFRALGWHIPVTPTGAVVTEVLSNGTAYAAGIGVQDLITSVNGRPVTSRCGVIAALRPMEPGTSIRLGITHQYFTDTGLLRVGRSHQVTLRTQAVPAADQGGSGCRGVGGPDRSFVGMGLEDGLRYTFPATVAIDTTNIGGPSAGLAMTLAIINKLSKTSITGHHLIATTGTIDPNGAVGDVGGVAEKTVAVEQAGAKYFFVPVAELAAAKSAAVAGLRIIPVSSLHQVLAYLRTIGGAAPVPITPPTKP